MPYKVKGNCVYKKDTGKKVGCTKGSVKKYLAALHANVNENFDWISEIPNDPVKWVKPEVTLDNVEMDEDGYPIHYGNGEGEIWIDFEKYTNQERIQIFHNIEKHLGGELIIDHGSARENKDVKIIQCTANNMKGLLLHCGHEENNFFSQENHVCCMNESYESFKEYEIRNGWSTLDGSSFYERPIVDGGIFLEKQNLDENFDWTQDVGITKEAIRNLMSNCEDVPVTNFNLGANSPYTKRGKMNIMYYSMCPYWWDRFKDLPVDEHGRGKGEWFTDNDRGETKVAVIMPDRNGVTDVRSEDDEDMSAITYDLKRIEPYFNGKSSELWLFLDENGDPRYDLLPDHLVDRVRKGFEGVEKPTTLEESFEWAEDIPEVDEDLWMKIGDILDDAVSVGPWSPPDSFREISSYEPLINVLDDYNIDIDNMENFFQFPPSDNTNKEFTQYQLLSLYDDLTKIGYASREDDMDDMLDYVNESNDFEWTEQAPSRGPLDGIQFTTPLNRVNRLTIEDESVDNDYVKVITTSNGTFDYHRGTVQNFLNNGTWVKVYSPLKEDFEWAEDIKPSWLHVGQKFVNIHHYNNTRKYNTDNKVQIGGNTFEIYHIFERDGEQYLKFTHHDTMARRNWSAEREIEQYPNQGLDFKQAKKNIDSGFWIPLDNCEFEASTHPNLIGKTKSDGTPYGYTYCKANVTLDSKWGQTITESDFDWVDDAPDYDAYRFFDVYTCDDNQYDEETGEDECLGGGSYFLRIPKEEVEEIWDLDIDDMGGPGDEGLGVIEWGERNDKFDPDDYAMVQYVREIDRKEFCMAVRHNNQDICGDFINESNDFEWAKEDLPPFYTLEWKDHPLAISAKKIWDDLDIGGEFTPPQFNTFKDLKQARKQYPNGKWISVVSGPNWIPAAFEDDPTDPEDINSDVLGDRFEVMSSEMEEPEIMTKDEINQYIDDFESSHNINESEGFDWADEVQGKPQVMDIFRVKGTRYTWTVVEELEGDRFMFKIRPKPDSSSAFQELSLDAVNHWLQTGNWVPEGREKYWYNLR